MKEPEAQVVLETMAKPGIPVKEPQRRKFPDIPNPMPERTRPTPLPTPVEPVRTPREPVPVGRNS